MRFKLGDILNGKDKSIINYDYKSSNMFYGCLENQFIIMPDQKTLLGFQRGSSNSKLIQEDITNKKSHIIILNQDRRRINTLSFDQSTNTLMVGDKSSTCIQYKRKSKKWQIIKKYHNLGIGEVSSSVIIGNLCV